MDKLPSGTKPPININPEVLKQAVKDMKTAYEGHLFSNVEKMIGYITNNLVSNLDDVEVIEAVLLEYFIMRLKVAKYTKYCNLNDCDIEEYLKIAMAQ